VLFICLSAAFWLSADPRTSFDRIEVGMADREVAETFGWPGVDHTDFGQPGPTYPGGEASYRLTWYARGFAFNVYFGADGMVVGKHAMPYPASGRLDQSWSQLIGQMRRASGL
jgi:hypothetical protein